MKTKVKCPFIFSIIFLFFFSFQARAANNLPVQIPQFPVELNGVKIIQQDTIFPMIIYRDITYLPMTIDYAELLNLNAHWIEDKRQLAILSTSNPITSYFQPNYYENASQEYPQNNLRAGLANYDIVINGKLINSQDDPYPILNFRNITYFPLTWNYAVNHLKLSYQFSSEKGLEIKSQGFRPENLPEQLPNTGAKHDYVDKLPALAESASLSLPAKAFNMPLYIKDGQVYYFVRQDQVMEFWRTPLNKKLEKIGQVPISTQEGLGFYNSSFENNLLLFNSHLGSSLMGSDNYYLISPNQLTSLGKGKGYAWLLPWQDKLVAATTGFPPIAQTGLFLIDGQARESSLFTDDFYYGLGHPWSQNPKLLGDQLYVLKKTNANSDGPGALYQINLSTKTQTKLIDKVQAYALDLPNIYFTMPGNQTLYVYNMEAKKTRPHSRLAKEIYNGFSVFHDTCLFMSKGNLYQANDHDPIQPTLLASKVSRWQSNPHYMVYLTDKAESQTKTIVIADSRAMPKYAFSYRNKDVDFHLNGKDLIIWSWQDQMLYYYKLP